ncbi:hypothetical protein GGS20DRAFT_331724 [Poronia punctata]|nr:hypothetical protein GGS20DRAFT_331724 [Poronia punctata]
MPPIPISTRSAALSKIPSIPSALRPRIYEGDTVPQGYGNSPSGPEPGVVAGIVLGSIAGFLLILLFVRWSLGLGHARIAEEGSVAGIGGGGGGAETNSSVVSRHSRPRPHPRRHHRRRRSQKREREKYEIRRERAVPVMETIRDEQIIVEEYRPRSRTRSRPPPPRTPPPPGRSVMSDEDEIVVLEEDEPPRRRRRESTDRRSMYRDDVYVRNASPPRSD